MLNYRNLNFLFNKFNISKYFFALIFFFYFTFSTKYFVHDECFLTPCGEKYIEIPREQIVNVCKKFQHSLCR
jgi:hypothetical protein